MGRSEAGIKAKREYDKNYLKENVKKISVSFNKNLTEDMELFEHLHAQSNIQKYVKDLIAKDLKKHK